MKDQTKRDENPVIELDIPDSDGNIRVCPKCGYEQDETNSECVRCGVVFQKLSSRPRPRGAGRHGTGKALPFLSVDSIRTLLFGVERPRGNATLIARAILLLLVFLLGIRFILAPIPSNVTGNSFLHLMNLPFHEAGHIFFRPFGRLITSMGGAMGQLLVPLICFSVLLFKTRDPFGAAIAFWWFGENFLDLAPYINDARHLTMPLIGGGTGRTTPYGFHDWQFILTETGLLQYDHFLAKLAWALGTAIMLSAVLWAGYLLFQSFRIPEKQ